MRNWKLYHVIQKLQFLKKHITYKILRLLLVIFFVLGSSAFIVKNLTPSDYTLRFKRKCDGVKCEKIKEVNSEQGTSIEDQLEVLSSTLGRLDFFARFTFLRFDFETTNQSQFIFAATEPKHEERMDIMMQCNLNGKNYIFSPNSRIIFQQKSSIGSILHELNKVQNILINCNPAPQDINSFTTFTLAPTGQIQFIYNEDKYHLRFLPDKWNYPLTVLQMLIFVGIFFGALYDIKRFMGEGF